MKAFSLLSSAAFAAVLSVCLGLSHARNQTRQPTRWSADADVDSGCFSLFSEPKVGYVCGKFDAAAAEM